MPEERINLGEEPLILYWKTEKANKKTATRCSASLPGTEMPAKLFIRPPPLLTVKALTFDEKSS